MRRDIVCSIGGGVLISILLTTIAMKITSSQYPILSAIILLFTSVVLFFVSHSLIRGRFDTLELGIIMVTFYTLYSLAVPLRICFSPNVSSTELYITIHALSLCLIGLISFIIGYHINIGKALANTLPFLFKWNDLTRIKQVAYLYVICGILLYIGNVELKVGILNYIKAGYAGRALLKREYGPVEIGIYILQVGLILWSIYDFLLRKKLSYSLILVCILYTIISFMIGIRRPLLGLIMGVLAVRHYLVKQIKIVELLTFLVIFFTLFSVFACIRQPISYLGPINGLKYAINNFSWDVFDPSKRELGAPFESLLNSLKIIPYQKEYLYGLSYWQSVKVLLPKSLYPFQPLTLSEWYTTEFFTEEFIKIGGNMGFFVISEAYVNCGIGGIILIMFALGFIFRMLYTYIRINSQNITLIFLYSLSLPWIPFYIRLDFASALKGFLFTTLIPALLAVILISKSGGRNNDCKNK